MQTHELLEAARRAGLDSVMPDLTRLVEMSIRLKATQADDASLTVGKSKIGGMPDLPSGTVWPNWKGVPQAFVAQINLTEVAQLDVATTLPSAGMLYFFYDSAQDVYGSDPADRGGWQVIFFRGEISQLSRADGPANLPDAARWSACALKVSSEATLPHEPEVLMPGLTWTDSDKQSYSDFLANNQPEAPRHRLLGHPDQIQDDMHLAVQLVSHGVSIYDAAPPAPVVKGAPNWQLLFQIDTDPQAGMRWANNGMVYYWIERDALKAGRFDAVWAMLQSE